MLSLLLGAMLQQAPTITYDNSSAHPLYTLDDETAKRAWMKGWELGKKKNGNLDKALDYLRTDIGTVRSPSWQSWKASCVLHLPPFARAFIAGFNSGRKFETYESEGRAYLEGGSGHSTDPARTLFFIVQLNAWPGINSYNQDINRRADEDDTKATDFVLLADERKISLKGSEKVAGESVDGGVVVPISDTSTVSTRVGGRSYDSTVTYSSTMVRGFTAYSATYSLRFPYFDPGGKPYITKDTKKLLLRVIMPKGVRDVTLDLTKAKIPY